MSTRSRHCTGLWVTSERARWQRLVPLERVLDRFGGDVPTGSRQFRITAATLAGEAAQTEPLDDLFAAGQFSALTDDEKLSQPSFAPMVSGARIGEHDVAFGSPIAVELDYEQLTVPAPTVSLPAPAPKAKRTVARVR